MSHEKLCMALVCALAAAVALTAGESTAHAQQPTSETSGDASGPVERVEPLVGGEHVGARRSRRTSSRSRRARRERRRRRARRPREVTVPVDVGLGPSFFLFGNPTLNGDDGLFTGPVYEDQTWHYGLRFEMAAIIDYEFVRKNPRLVPRKYRKMFKKDTVVHYTPGILALVPRNLFISPKTGNTGIYGATWQFLHVGLPLVTKPVRFTVGAGAVATYAYIDSDVFDSTHFLRPGVDVGVDLRVPLGDAFALTVGWDSNLYLPQDIGGGIFEGSSDDALWHIGEGFVTLHYKFPFTTKL